MNSTIDINNTRNDTQNDTQDATKTQEKTQGGLIYAKNQLQITAANHLLNDKSSIVAEGDIVPFMAEKTLSWKVV
jgi:adhesin HecA-like repeat protein